MATIIEDYVSFETTKLLKKKGFNELCAALYDLGNGEFCEKQTGYVFNNSQWDSFITAPTLQMAMKWLREVHNIHIIAEPCLGEGNEPNLSFNRWFWTILKEEGEYKPIRKIDEFTNYEQAVEAAIKYCLENLI